MAKLLLEELKESNVRARRFGRTMGMLVCLPLMPCLAQQEGQATQLNSSSASASGDALAVTQNTATNPVNPATDSPSANRGSSPGAASTPTAVIAVNPTGESLADEPSGRPHALSRVMEEIVVTAQKREENIQDVPIAVSAFSAGKLEALGVEQVDNLPNVTPGLTITRTGAADVVYLRGVGTDAFLPGVDPSVPYYLDGVLLLSGQGTSTALDHVSRVEVLKGPQGTLFGASSVGGAINVVTAEPSQEFSSDVTLGYGNYNAMSLKAFTNVPLTDNLATSVSMFSTRQDNCVHNSVGSVIGEYTLGGRLKLRWDITSNLYNTLSASYQEISDNVGLAWNNTRVAPVLAAVLPQAPETSFDISTNSVGGSRATSYVVADTLGWALPFVDVKAVGSIQNQHPYAEADFDGTRVPVSKFVGRKETFGQYTAELQFTSNSGTPFGDRLSWVGGFFYNYIFGGFDPLAISVAPNLLGGLTGPSGDKLTAQLNALLNPITQAATGIDLNNGVVLLSHGILKGSATSAYWQGTLHFTDYLALIVGGRYQRLHRDLENSYTDVENPSIVGGTTTVFRAHPPTLHAQQFSPRVSLQWYPFHDSTQVYASWAEGYKSPTYNTVNLLGTTFGPIEPVKAQKNEAYELGIKTLLLDGNLQLNAAGFYTKEKDLLNGFIALLTGGVVAYNNVPSAEIKGVEFDTVWTPLPVLDSGFAVTLSAAYLDAKYTDFPNGQGFDEATGLAFGPGGPPEPPLPERNFSGNRIVRTPKLTFNASLNQTLELGDGRLELSLDGNYNSGFYFLPQNSSLFETTAYTILNTHATYTYLPWGIETTLYCQNLANEMHIEAEFVDDFGRTTMPNAPRTYGARIKWMF